MYIKIEGSYKDVAEWLGFSFATQSGTRQELKAQIQEDIPRTPFVSFNKTFNDLKAAWAGDEVSLSFTQGNISGTLFGSLLAQNFLGASFRDSQASKLLNIDDTEYLNLLQAMHRNDLTFAFFNSKNQPCGLGITYIEGHPDWWIATLMTNTVADPEKRQVKIFGKLELLNAHNAHFTWPSSLFLEIANPGSAFLSAIDSEEIKKWLMPVFNADNQVNADHIQRLKGKLIPGQNVDNWDEKIPLLNACIEGVYFGQDNPEQIKEYLFFEMYNNRQAFSSEAGLKQCIQNLATELVIRFSEKKTALAKIPRPRDPEPNIFQRNAFTFFMAGLCALSAFGTLFVLTGVLAPLGIAIQGVTATLIIAAFVVSLSFTLICFLKIGMAEYDYSIYRDSKLKTEQDEVKKINQCSNQHLSKLFSGAPVRQSEPDIVLQTTALKTSAQQGAEIEEQDEEESGLRLSF